MFQQEVPKGIRQGCVEGLQYDDTISFAEQALFEAVFVPVAEQALDNAQDGWLVSMLDWRQAQGSMHRDEPEYRAKRINKSTFVSGKSMEALIAAFCENYYPISREVALRQIEQLEQAIPYCSVNGSGVLGIRNREERDHEFVVTVELTLGQQAELHFRYTSESV